MVPYRMNMARGQVLSPETRQLCRRWLTVYFVAVLLVLAVSVGFLTHTCVALSRQQTRLELGERQFLAEHPDAGSVSACLRGLSREMTACEDRLKAVDDFRKGVCGAGAILWGLVNVMPAGMDLGRAGLDEAGAKLTYEVYVQEGRKRDDGMTPPKLISLWNADPLLSTRVRDLTAEKSEHVRVSGREVVSWHFTGTLGGAKP